MNLTIKMKYRTIQGWLLWLIIVMPFLFGFLNEFLGLPWSIRYLLDIAWCMLVVYQFLRTRKHTTLLEIWVWLFLIYTLLIYLIQFQSPLYYLWGVRNNFRFYVMFFACCSFLNKIDVQDYWKLMEKLFWVNTLVSVFQFFVLGLKGDYLGGLFGAQRGSNGYTNLFFIIMMTQTIVFYLKKTETAGNCLAKCAAGLVVAAMAELKFFFMEFLLIVLLAVVFTDFTFRKLMVIFAGVVGVAACVALLVSLFPNYAGWFTLSSIFESASSSRGYTSSGDLNRLNAIPQINELWLQSKWQQMFGLGLGNCETSSYAILNTPFFVANEDMHYSWIGYAFLYLETGWIGLLFYWGFFALMFFTVWKIEKSLDQKEKPYCVMVRIISVLCIVVSVYNSSLRTEAGYMVFFVLAIPFVLSRQEKCRRREIYAKKLFTQSDLQRKGQF